MDSRAAEYGGKACLTPQQLDRSRHFVISAVMRKYPEIDALLSEKGFVTGTDILFPMAYSIGLSRADGFRDMYGNEIRGSLDGIQVNITGGFSNLVVIGEGVKQGRDISIDIRGSGNLVVIGDGTLLGDGGKIRVWDNSVLCVGEHSQLHERFRLDCRYNSRFCIAEGFVADCDFDAIVLPEAECRIGAGGLFSHHVRMVCGDGHNIFDLAAMQNHSRRKSHCLTVGEHVWVGMNAVLATGSDIGSGSIVGAASFVNKRFPSNSAIGGNPAALLRENIAWNGCNYPYLDSYEDFRNFDFR